jgi:hypothetical protein
VPGSKTNPRCTVPLTRLGIISQRCSANSPSEAILATYGTVRQGQCQLRDTVPPTLVQPTFRTLEKGRRNPRKGGGRLFHACPRPYRGFRPVGRVSSVTVGPAQPSRHHDVIPGTATPSLMLWGYGRQDAATPAAVRPTASRQLHPQVSIRTTTKRGISIPPPSKPLLGGYRARHDAPPEARFARTAVHSVALSAMPSHVARTVRHACKLPPPWPIKGGAVHWPQGDDKSTHTRTLTAFITILALASIKNL